MTLSDDLLSAYVDDQVSQAERQQIAAAIAADPSTAAALAQLRYTRGLLAELPALAVPRAFTLSEADVPARPAWAWLARLQPLYLRGAMALAAVCLLVLAAGDLGYRAQLLPTDGSALEAPGGGLAADQGDPTAVSGKTSTGETAQQPATFLGLSPQLLLGLEIALAALLLLLLLVWWQFSRSGWQP